VLPVLESHRPGPGRLAGFVLLLLAVAAGLAAFSAYPWAASPPGVALLKVAFKHVSAPEERGAALSHEELEKLPRHMRPQGDQTGASGRRRDTTVRVALDGRPLFERTYRPGGLRHDGPTFVYEELTLPLGRHVLDAALVEMSASEEEEEEEAHATSRRERRIVVDVEVRPGQVFLLELSNGHALTLRQGERSLVTEPR
jgi:hypothetical protein